MADLQCVICDFTVTPQNPDDEVLALLGAGGSEAAGQELLVHMEGHTLADWVRAFKMADAYIEKLEGQLEQALSASVQLAASRPQPVQMPQEFRPTFVDDMPGLPDNLEHFFTPEEIARKRQQARIRAEIEAADPDQTLIPRIPDAVRPEGVVGVKY